MNPILESAIAGAVIIGSFAGLYFALMHEVSQRVAL